MRSVRRATALSLLAAALAACGGTITYGSSKPNPNGQPAGSIAIPSQPPFTPPPGTTLGTLLGFDARTGNPLWQAQAPMADMFQPVVAGGMVFVQGGYGGAPSILAAFNASGGHLVWRAGSPSVCGLTSAGTAILMVFTCQQSAGAQGIAQQVLSAIDPRTGRELWTAVGAGAAVGSGPVLLLVPSENGDYKVRGLNPLSGQQLWQARLTATNIPPLVSGQVALVWQQGCLTSENPPDVTGGSCNGPGQARSFVSRLDPFNGAQLWQAGFGQGGQLRRLLLGDVAVFSVDVELKPSDMGQPPSLTPPPGSIGALDPATGTELWRQTVETEQTVPALAVPGTVFVEEIKPSTAANQCPITRLDALDSRSGQFRWRIDNVPACQMTVDSDGQTVAVVLMTFSGTKLLVLDGATGTELWEKTMATTGVYQLMHAAVSGGVVYVAESGHFVAPSPVAGD